MLDYKQCIIVRSDIKMGKGKLAAQVAHAAVEAVLKCLENPRWRQWLREWINEGQKKIVLKVSSLDELEKLEKIALELGLPTAKIVDAGKTQLPPGTVTALAIGPAPSDLIDRITRGLKLL